MPNSLLRSHEAEGGRNDQQDLSGASTEKQSSHDGDCVIDDEGIRRSLPEAIIDGKEVIGMAIDPVCKMEVDEKKAAATYEYKGKKYYFCAAGCKDKFSKDPEKFLGKEKK
jgi:YHS domain-containing protein